MAQEELVVHGAREHNLKDIDVRLPRNKLICITGLSGSGKSSLAFDTIYAEGQRRYVESLSAYARQFLQMMEKPDIDSIEGLLAGDLDRPEDDLANPRAPSTPSTRTTTICAFFTRGSAGRTARSAGSRSRGRARSRSSTRSSS
jgi:excinuclease UvrABC ATPase subunit